MFSFNGKIIKIWAVRIPSDASTDETSAVELAQYGSIDGDPEVFLPTVLIPKVGFGTTLDLVVAAVRALPQFEGSINIP